FLCVGDVKRLPDKKVVLFRKQFREPRLPKRMNSRLPCQLAVVVLRRVEWDVCICNVMCNLSGVFQYSPGVFYHERVAQTEVHALSMPWKNPVRLERVFSVFFNSLCPI